ncbi:response regulator [Candidatus Pacearchaeota archaeon]|nr:response regulator [Candidatus Pacearchaeota archaeon]
MNKKILVVDDNRIVVSFMTKILEQDGHEVFSAEDGLTALEMLTSLTPDIMFIDLVMPNIGGDKLCQIIREMSRLKDCYIVIVSGAVGEIDLDYTKIGADTCIAKGPFSEMKEYVLEAVKESDSPRKDGRGKPIMGLGALESVPIYARQMTKELLSRNRHLETILESIAEGILEIHSARVVYANSAAVSLFGVPQEKLLASHFIDLFEENLQPRVESLLKSETGRPSEIGLHSPLEINDRLVIITKLPVKSDPAITIILITDITRRKRLEMQLQHVQKMDAIGTIASGIAHNFRNTLAGILANTQVIQMSLKDDSELHENANRIDTSVKRGVQLVEGLMQFSRKQINNELQSLNLAKVVQETYQLVKESFDKRIDIRINVPESLPVIGDHLGLSQALMNLCTNARDSMPNGGELRIEAMQKGDKAVVVVSDTGQGMDKAMVQKCFDPFFTTKEVGKGTGLGLSTTYGIIKNHEGEISVTSEPNKGTIFKVLLPLDISREQDKQEYMTEIVQGNGEKVLVVDDEMAILRAMPSILERLGYQAAIANNGKEAIEKYKAWQPDVVLIDIGMPIMDGLTCIERIADYDPNAKAIVISGYEEDVLNGLDQRKKKLIKGFLVKPFGKYELSASLAQLLK